MYFTLKKSMNFCKNHFARKWSIFYFWVWYLFQY